MAKSKFADLAVRFDAEQIRICKAGAFSRIMRDTLSSLEDSGDVDEPALRRVIDLRLLADALCDVLNDDTARAT